MEYSKLTKELLEEIEQKLHIDHPVYIGNELWRTKDGIVSGWILDRIDSEVKRLVHDN